MVMKAYKIQSMIRGFNYYLKIGDGSSNKRRYIWEGLIENATELTEEQATHLAACVIRDHPKHDETKIINAKYKNSKP